VQLVRLTLDSGFVEDEGRRRARGRPFNFNLGI
jgi:hypothetical protein